MSAWFDTHGPIIERHNRRFERNVYAPFRPRNSNLTPGLPDRAARAHESKPNRPPNVAPKLDVARAYLHWLNAQIVRGHRHNDTPGRGAP